jgi:hypothetical protein
MGRVSRWLSILVVLVLLSVPLAYTSTVAQTPGTFYAQPHSPWKADFGLAQLGGFSTNTIEVVNDTDEPMDDIVVVNDGPFQHEIGGHCHIGQDGLIDLAPHSWCTIGFSFHPPAVGRFDGTLRFVGNDGAAVATIAVWGEGVLEFPEPGCQPGSDTTPPVVDEYYIEGIASIDKDAGTYRGWPVHHGHDNVGIDHYEEQSRRVGGEGETLFDAAGVGVFPTGPAQLRIRAIDQACNASDWKVIDSDVRAVDAVEGVGITTAGVSQAYVGQWRKRTAVGAYRRTLMANQTSGSKARLVATGTRYALVVRRTTAGGRIGIYVDGVRVRTVDLRSTGGLK